MGTTHLTTTAEHAAYEAERMIRRLRHPEVERVEVAVVIQHGNAAVAAEWTPAAFPLPSDPGPSPQEADAEMWRQQAGSWQETAREMETRADAVVREAGEQARQWAIERADLEQRIASLAADRADLHIALDSARADLRDRAEAIAQLRATNAGLQTRLSDLDAELARMADEAAAARDAG